MIKKTIVYITWIKIIFLFLGFSLLFFAWFNSRSSNEISNEKIVFMLDVSNSMNVKDVFYNWNQISRLEMAKIYIKEYINNGNNNIWLIIFAGKANFFIPPTKDKLSIITYLDTINSNSIIWWGSNIYEAIKKFVDNSKDDAMWIILSDFGDNVDYQEQIDLLKKINIKWKKIIAIWIGTVKWWLVENNQNKLITHNGEAIRDSLNLAYLTKISSIVKYPYQILDDEKKFKVWNHSKKWNFFWQEWIYKKWAIILGSIFIIIGL